MGDYKLVEYYDPPSVELFDLSKDIGETNDLSGVDVQKVEKMKASFKEWLMDFNPILHTENPNYNPNYRSN
jgi:hypothetical protein